MADAFVICDDIDTCLSELRSSEGIALAISRKHITNSPLFSTETIYCFSREQNIQTIPISFLMGPHFELLPRINQYLRMFMESGLLAKWERDSTANVQAFGANSYTFDRIILHHFVGSFTMWICGCILAALVLLIEIIIHRTLQHSKRRIIRSISLIIAKLIDGRRYN